ncbi:radical SAM protein [Streptomyces sp. SID4985]|nr:radical SAM protein [Streptomyces sp. SID4985]MYQ48848.1 radical SAM protein [Streptomyces sp. SID4985]
MGWSRAGFYQVTADGVQCVLCPFRCRLRPGETGACRVRRRRDDTVETLTLDTTVVHQDTVERKPFYHFRPGSRVITLAPPGCSFRCDYCVNHRLSQYGRDDGDTDRPTTPVDVDDVVERAAAERAGIALSYSEPSLAAELTLRLADVAATRGVPVLWKSNGFVTPEALDVLAPGLAAVNIDIKAADDTAHRRLTGAPLAPVLETVRALHRAGVWVEVSTPLIPGTSASDTQLDFIAGFLASVGREIPWHLLRFTPTYRMADEVPTTPERLARAVRIGRSAGLAHVYVERALGAKGRATHCPRCSAEVIGREVWGAVEVSLVDGACPVCGTVIPGVWS